MSIEGYSTTERPGTSAGTWVSSTPLSVSPGDRINIHVSAEQSFTYRFIRMSSNAGNFIAIDATQPGFLQDVPERAWEGCNWQKSFSYVVPSSWKTGLYACQL